MYAPKEKSALTVKDMPDTAQTAQPHSGSSSVRVRLEDGTHPDHKDHCSKRLLPESQTERHGIREHMKPEDAQEEGAKRVKHLGEEVPPEAGIRCQIR